MVFTDHVFASGAAVNLELCSGDVPGLMQSLTVSFLEAPMMGRHVTLAGALAVGLLCSGLAFGDDTKSTKSDSSKPAAKAALPAHFKQLGLNDEQREKVTSVLNEYKARIDALNKELTELRQKQHEEIAKLLTEQQKEHLKQIMATNALGESHTPKRVTPAKASDAEIKKDDKKEDKK
jgi:hypothetical protein